MVHTRKPASKVIVHLQTYFSVITQSYAWVATAVLTILLALAFADMFLSAFGIFIEGIPLLVSLPFFQSATTWLLMNMSLAFAIHYTVRPDTRLDLTFLWCLSLIFSAILYWY